MVSEIRHLLADTTKIFPKLADCSSSSAVTKEFEMISVKANNIDIKDNFKMKINKLICFEIRKMYIFFLLEKVRIQTMIIGLSEFPCLLILIRTSRHKKA
jgi:hypothetical protein